MTLASHGLLRQVPAALSPHPDAIRLAGSIVPSGIPLYAAARVFVGDQWRQCSITATGTTWVQVSMQRHGNSTVHDRRNLLLRAEWTAYTAACRRWKREQQQRQAKEGE